MEARMENKVWIVINTSLKPGAGKRFFWQVVVPVAIIVLGLILLAYSTPNPSS